MQGQLRRPGRGLPAEGAAAATAGLPTAAAEHPDAAPGIDSVDSVDSVDISTLISTERAQHRPQPRARCGPRKPRHRRAHVARPLQAPRSLPQAEVGHISISTYLHLYLNIYICI